MLQQNVNKVILIATLFFIFFLNLHSANETIGSDIAVSREAHNVFDGFNNRIAGFAAMEQGFSFLDGYTTCSFDSFFPVKQQIDLNNGSLFLSKNLIIEDAIDITNAGKIYGDNYFLQFPELPTTTDPNFTLTIPTSDIGVFTLLDSMNFPSQPYTLEWSNDNVYHAIGAGNILYMLYFDDITLTQTASVNVGGQIYSIRFHPGTYEIACGSSAGLAVYKWNIENGTFTLQDSTGVGGRVMALGWRNDGNYIAFLRQANPELQIYSYDGSNLTYVTQIDIPGGSPRGIAIDTLLSWRADGQYLTTGFSASASNPELYVHNFNGTSLTLSASAETSEYIITLDWCATNSLIALGLWGSSERFRVYEHNATSDTLNEIQSARMGITDSVETIAWKKDGKYIAWAQDDSSDPEFKIYKFNQDNRTFIYQMGYDISPRTGYNIRWSNNVPDSNELLFAGFDNNRELYIFDIQGDPFYFDNLNTVFNSDVILKGESIFSGNSSIDGNNHVITLVEAEGKITVTTNAVLILKNLTIKDISVDNLNCFDDSGKIIFDNVTLIPKKDLYFSNGSFEIYNTLNFYGNHSFNYITNQQSTIHSKAELKLYQDATFSYTTKSNINNLIVMEDESAQITLNKASLHSTPTGLELTKGILKIKGNCNIISDGESKSEGIKFGDGIDGTNDLKINIEPESNLSLISGHWTYKNIN